MAEEVLKVHLRNDNIKYIIVPRKCKIMAEEYVVVSNNLNMLKKSQKEEQNGRRKKI